MKKTQKRTFQSKPNSLLVIPVFPIGGAGRSTPLLFLLLQNSFGAIEVGLLLGRDDGLQHVAQDVEGRLDDEADETDLGLGNVQGLAVAKRGYWKAWLKEIRENGQQQQQQQQRQSIYNYLQSLSPIF